MWRFWGAQKPQVHDRREESNRLPVDDALERIDNASPLHSLMVLGHVEEKLDMGRKHLDFYRRKGLGMSTSEKKKADDEVKILSTGNVHVTQAEKQQSGIGKMIATGAIVASMVGIPGAGIIGYLLSQVSKPQPVPSAPATPGSDTDFVPGLLKLGDLITPK